jgi:glutamyl-tRNA synthetase
MIERIAPLAQPRLETLADWGYKTAFFFADEVPLDPEALRAIKGLDDDALLRILQLASWRLDALRPFTAEAIEHAFRELAEQLGLKLRDLTRPFYLVMTGAPSATPLYQSMEILGADLCRMRVRRAIAALGGLSAKRLKALEKEHAALTAPR